MEDIKLLLTVKEPHELLAYVRQQMRVKDKTEDQRDAILIAKELFKEKTGRPISHHDLIKN